MSSSECVSRSPGRCETVSQSTIDNLESSRKAEDQALPERRPAVRLADGMLAWCRRRPWAEPLRGAPIESCAANETRGREGEAPAELGAETGSAGALPSQAMGNLGLHSGALLLSAASIGTVYWPTAVELIRSWDVDPNYSHGFVVPVLSLLFAVASARRAGLPWETRVPGRAVCRGLAKIALGLGLHVVAFFLGHLLLDVVSLICVLRGTALALGGREVDQTLGFAALFLIFMAPVPMAWYQPVARLLQGLVSDVSANCLELLGVAVYREGNFIHLAEYTLEVGEACSGLRQLMGVLALAVAIGYFGSTQRWYRWVLATLAIPIAVAANCLRVLFSGLVLLTLGRRWGEGVFHSLEGMVLTGLAGVFLLGVARYLSRWERPCRS